MNARVGYVAIGRNEGERLRACLSSLRRDPSAIIVYVDSGSTDSSLEAAREFGAQSVELDTNIPFTAARARNAGASRLLELAAPDFIQFVDGDCTLDADWMRRATGLLDARKDVAVVCGRRRERFPDASVYNRLCDIEWASPIGDALSCGGDALMRAAAFEEAGRYDESLIAGEEPELCVRLRAKGWKIHRIDAEMTLHDAAMTRFRQWWKRSVRAGHAFAEVSHIHRRSPCGVWKRETRRALAWASIAPLALILSVAVHPSALVILAVYPLQFARLSWTARNRLGGAAAPWALFTILGKFPEALGVVKFHVGRAFGRRAGIVEYK
ncbi:MAG: glycosyltransferase family 2 protein [Parvularculaceae bacterium]|nr:glycosyltransferase family 2 protein [Parvularculaceae bacterium]